MGTIDWLGEQVAGIGTPLLAALLICFIGGAVSAFASTDRHPRRADPARRAVPAARARSARSALIIALSISSSVVDSSPFSTNGALVVANAPEDRRELVFQRLMQWGMSMIIIAPIARVAGLRGARLGASAASAHR